MRPFGVSCWSGHRDSDGSVKLYKTNPSGTYSAWKAVRRQERKVGARVFGEKRKENMTQAEGIKLAMKALLEVVPGKQNVEVVVITESGIDFLSEEKVAEVCADVEKEKADAVEKEESEK